MIIATDRRQARIIHRYVGALLSVPALRQLLERETATGFDLNNQVTIEIHTASFRSTRGYAIIAACLDELAFWPTEADNAEPDYEVINTASRYGAIPDLCPVVCELALFQERCVVGGLPPTLRSRRR